MPRHPGRDELKSSLRDSPFFARLGEKELNRIASLARLSSYQRKEIIIFEGEQVARVFFVIQGWVREYLLSLEGKIQFLRTIGPGEVFNLVPIFDGGPSPTNVEALTPVTLCYFERETFLEIISKHPEVAVAIIENLTARMRHFISLVGDLALRDVKGRLAGLLLRMADREKGLPPVMTRKEMAAHLGTVREVVGRALKALQEEGLIRIERHRIIILDREALEARAGSSLPSP